jgi:hypothetical protein
MDANKKLSMVRLRIAMFVATAGLLLGNDSEPLLGRRPVMIRRRLRAVGGAGRYAGWVVLFAIAGTLSAVAAVAIQESFVSSTLLVLTVGEWELLAVVFYILAILLYLADDMHSRR